MVSLTLTPLRLESVGEIDCDNPHVPVYGTAYLPSGAPWVAYPKDVPFDAAMATFDVCNAASQVRSSDRRRHRHRAGARGWARPA